MQNEIVRFEQSRNVRSHGMAETSWKRREFNENDRVRVLHEVEQGYVAQIEEARRMKLNLPVNRKRGCE
jgi:CRISPR/Cas system CMR-associated protein Cmr3 (group 5 of RAMP superfamily)